MMSTDELKKCEDEYSVSFRDGQETSGWYGGGWALS